MKPTRKRLMILALISTATLINYLDRSVMGVAKPDLVRELHIDRDTPLIDFAGRRTSSADFARRLQVRLVPTVMFHGPAGEPLAEAIVGFRLADFYGAYLERAIEESRARLKARK